MSQEGRVALVTGAGSGIGRAVVLRLARDGADLFVNDLDARRAESVAAEARQLGVRAWPVLADVARLDAVERMFEEVRRRADRLDILVNQAGKVAWPEYIHQPEGLTPEEWVARMTEDPTLAQGMYLRDDDFEDMLAASVHGAFYCCHLAIPSMRANGWGRIVNLTSAGGGIGGHDSPQYAAAKGAVIGLTRALARELLHDDIIVNAVSMGFIDSAIWDRIRTQYPQVFDPTWRMEGEGEARRIYPLDARKNPLGIARMGTPSEVASLVSYLASDEAAYLVGQNFNFTGGNAIP